jgi:transposase
MEDARLPLHNNASELRLREIAVGGKNYLFAGSDAGAERAACVYTLVANMRAGRSGAVGVPG